MREAEPRLPEPRLAVRALRPLVVGLRSLGHDPIPWLAEAGVRPAVLDDPDGYVPMSAGVGLLARAAGATGDANIGLHLAERADPGSFDVRSYAMLSSPTLGAAFERLGRYQRLVHETNRVELAVSEGRATLRHPLPGGGAAPRHSAEFIVAAWVRVGRLVTGVDWAPAEVRFAHPRPEGVRDHERFFRAPVRFGTGETALVLPAALLDTACVRSDPALLAVLDRHAGALLDRAPRAASVADRARAVLVEEGPGGAPGAARLAARLRMSVRTLNRLLAAEGTSYRRLLDQIRNETAARRLAEDRLSIAEIGFLLGVSDLSAFHRAFKRWTGTTPAAFRAAARRRSG